MKSIIKGTGCGLRVTGGTLKGRAISAEEGLEARYTPSKVRQAIFNILGDVSGSCILDIFAGAGSFAIEALSRGAASAVCVEQDAGRASIIRKNLDSLQLNRCCQVLDMDVRYAIPFLRSKGAVYDIIFMDPPYGKGYVAETMSLLEKESLYHDETLIVVEHSKQEALITAASLPFVSSGTKHYGDTLITLFTTRSFP